MTAVSTPNIVPLVKQQSPIPLVDLRLQHGRVSRGAQSSNRCDGRSVRSYLAHTSLTSRSSSLASARWPKWSASVTGPMR